MDAESDEDAMAPKLQQLCVQRAIDNVAYLSDVGDTDASLLAVILPHCTEDQLLRIETCTKGRDLTPITNDLWRKIYQRRFGEDRVKAAMAKMERLNKVYTWRSLYEAKLRDREKEEQAGVSRLKQLYQKAEQEKVSRQLVVCEKLPPASRKRKNGPSSFGRGGSAGSGSSSSTRGRLMKKARMEYAASNEARSRSQTRKVGSSFTRR